MKKMLIIIVCVIVLGILIFALIGYLSSTPITKKHSIDQIQKTIDKQIGKKNITNAIVLVDSEKYDMNVEFVAGKMNGKDIEKNQPFHIASIGKAFTATLIGCLMEDGLLSLDDKISEYLDDDILEGLFLYNGVDYKDKVTIAHLLSHTSGIADYFEDKTTEVASMSDLVLNEKDKIWTPIELVNFTREYQKAVGAAGEKYHYSDTGYILLGMIIEQESGKDFDEVLSEKIFIPLEMKDSYLMFYSKPINEKEEIADVWFKGVNIKDYNSLSIDWSGGGIVSTAKDLSTFVRALNNYQIISEQTLSKLYNFDQNFMKGIHYGKGFMEYHFDEYVPSLSIYPNFVGHMGILGTQMFYDKLSDTVYISSFGSSAYSGGSVRTMIKVIGLLMRIDG